MVKKFLLAAAALVTLAALGPVTAVARAPVVVSGGGTGTFDGIHPGSQFGMGVVLRRISPRTLQLRDGRQIGLRRASADEGRRSGHSGLCRRSGGDSDLQRDRDAAHG